MKEEVRRFWHVPLQGTHSIYPTFMKATGHNGENTDLGGQIDLKSNLGSIIYQRCDLRQILKTLQPVYSPVVGDNDTCLSGTKLMIIMLISNIDLNSYYVPNTVLNFYMYYVI